MSGLTGRQLEEFIGLATKEYDKETQQLLDAGWIKTQECTKDVGASIWLGPNGERGYHCTSLISSNECPRAIDLLL